MLEDQTPSHEFIDHTSELGLRLHGPDLASLFSQSVVALAALLDPDPAPNPTPESRDVSVSAFDRTGLLVEWLNELIFLAETGPWCPKTAEIITASDTEVVARVLGVRLPVAPSLVKATTYHHARVGRSNGTWNAEVIFDI